MSCSDIFYKNGEEIRSSLLKCEVSILNLEIGHLQLKLTPYDEDVMILRKYYDNAWNVENMHTLDCFFIDCIYDDINDSIEFNMHTSFDLFLFNICALLGIGRLKTSDDFVDIGENGFAHIYQRVNVFYLTLEEFKLLDGFIGKFTLNGSSVSFDGLFMRFDCIHESVSDGADVPDVKSKLLKRGERLLVID